MSGEEEVDGEGKYWEQYLLDNDGEVGEGMGSSGE